MAPDKIRKPRRRRWLVVVLVIVIFIGLGQVILDHFREEEKSIRQRFRKAIVELFPEQAAKISASFGLRLYKNSSLSQTAKEQGKTDVVLIHGLDDPGKIWMNLAPALTYQGYRVWIMTYPNDQPVSESARLFATELSDLRLNGINQIVIVAHSMGGLVSRQMLTDPDIDYPDQTESGQIPVVVSLVMVGTPNYGSELARLRGFTELRDQIARFSKGDGHWLGGILDGAGEAKLDLLPGSRFLETLNARPHPEGIDMLVIAGIATPWNEAEIEMLALSLQEGAPENMFPMISDLKSVLLSMTHGLGDGLVTVDSASLEEIPLLTVPGTHLSIIRNLSKSSERIPPAVPIITEWISRYSSDTQAD
jgi:pimeloyl-ACP methyl ester carboxylesterase